MLTGLNTDEPWSVEGHGDGFTITGDGYVSHNGRNIEHFNCRSQLTPAWKADALVRIRHLEALGVPVNSGTFVWTWSWWKGLTPDCPYLPLLRLQPGFYQHGFTVTDQANARKHCCPVWPAVEPDGSVAVVSNNKVVRFKKGEGPSLLGVEADYLGGFYHPMVAANYHTAQMGQGGPLGPCYANSHGLVAWLDQYIGVDGVGPIVDLLNKGAKLS